MIPNEKEKQFEVIQSRIGWFLGYGLAPFHKKAPPLDRGEA